MRGRGRGWKEREKEAQVCFCPRGARGLPLTLTLQALRQMPSSCELPGVLAWTLVVVMVVVAWPQPCP